MRSLITLLCLCLCASLANAGQDPAGVRRAIDDFMKVQVKGLPGTASYTIGNIVTSDRLGACPNLQVSLPRGGRLWGRSNVVVRCDEPGWSLYVPVRVKVVGAYLVSSRALRQGQQVVVVRRGGRVQVYRNGEAESGGEMVGAVGNELIIDGLEGKVDELAVYRRAMTAVEVSNHWLAGRGR